MNRCDKAKCLRDYQNLFLQITDTYSRQQYHLACIGLFAIADGLMADISTMKKSTSFEKRIKSIEQKMADKIELDTIDRRTFFIHLQFDSLGDNLSNSVFGFSDFTKDEPNELNRHWLLHGRTHKTYSRYDFLKILLWIDQLPKHRKSKSPKPATALSSLRSGRMRITALSPILWTLPRPFSASTPF